MKLTFSTSDLQNMFCWLVALADLAWLGAAGLLTLFIRFSWQDRPEIYTLVIVFALTVFFLYAQFTKLWSLETLRFPQVQIGRVSLTWGSVILTLVVAAFLTKSSDNVSRVWVVTWVFIAYLGLIVLHLLASRRIKNWQRRGLFCIRVAVIGSTENIRYVTDQLAKSRDSNYRLIGVFICHENDGGPAVGDHRGYESLTELLASIRESEIDEVIIALPLMERDQILSLLDQLKTTSVEVKICPDLAIFELPLLGHGSVDMLPAYDLQHRPMSIYNRVLKELEDRVLGAILLALLAVPMLIIALLIALDSRGPILFHQVRTGFDGGEFEMFKFRTMAHHVSGDHTVAQAQKGDPRITRVGRFLRKFSLDELPNLFNVLRGEMSLVGPRPHATVHTDKFSKLIDDFMCRHRVKPGMTGWAQINGFRGETQTVDKMRERFNHDIYYIENWSLYFDFKVLVLTAFLGFYHQNAY